MAKRTDTDHGLPWRVQPRMTPGQPSAALLDTNLYLRNRRQLRRDNIDFGVDTGSRGQPVQNPICSSRVWK
jgi:hypothetical protein